MKKFLMMVMGCAAGVVGAADYSASAAAVGTTSAPVRFDGRTGNLVATGVERRGDPVGGPVTTWNTASEADGWRSFTVGEETVSILALNEVAVEGGRLVTNEVWSADRVHVVRDDVVIPSGKSLTLPHGCVVKFTEGARFVTLAGGTLRAEGANLAELADDAVGGDTNHDADDTAPCGIAWWREDAATEALATVAFLDGAAVAAPARSYTTGVAYGELPVLEKDGFIFDGWFTAPDGAGGQVTSETAASKGVEALYAAWTALSLEVTPAATNVAPVMLSYTFDVSANARWSASTESDWIFVPEDNGNGEGDGDGRVVFIVEFNKSPAARSGTIRVALTGTDIFRDFTVTQDGMATLAAPTINPADGTTFSGAARRVSISGIPDGATVRYTLDGSEPTETSILYAKSFNVFDTTIVKAKAFKDGWLPSETVSARFIRLQTLPEAIDQPLWTVTTGGDAEWDVATDVSYDGKSSARSGAIGPMESTWMETTVEGAGTLSFRWKVVCEDDPDYDSWDFLALYVDDLDIEHVDGDAGWQSVSVKVKGDGTHTIRWEFSKDDIDDFELEDTAWVDQVVWTPVVGDAEVPVAWLEGLNVAGASGDALAAARADSDGDGVPNAEEYVMGTDPNDAESKLTALIEMDADGNPVVTYAPDLLQERKYTKWGKHRLDDPNEEWVEVSAGQERNFNFFKVVVEMP